MHVGSFEYHLVLRYGRPGRERKRHKTGGEQTGAVFHGGDTSRVSFFIKRRKGVSSTAY
jgi:hypothetical protein